MCENLLKDSKLVNDSHHVVISSLEVIHKIEVIRSMEEIESMILTSDNLLNILVINFMYRYITNNWPS